MAADYQILLFGGAAVKLDAVNAAAVIDDRPVAVRNRSVADRLPAAGVVESRLDALFDLFVGDRLDRASELQSLESAEFDVGLELNGRAVLERAVADRVDVDLGRIDREELALLVEDLAVSFRQNYIHRVFVKYANAVHALDDLAGRLALAKALYLEFALVLVVCLVDRGAPLVRAHFDGEFDSVFLQKFFGVVHKMTSQNLFANSILTQSPDLCNIIAIEKFIIYNIYVGGASNGLAFAASEDKCPTITSH